MPNIRLGHADGNVTAVIIPDDRAHDEAARDIIHEGGVWNAHSNDPAPEWVDGDDAELVEAIASHFNCPVGQPE